MNLPDPWADPKSRSTLGFHNLHDRNIRIQNWGLWILLGVWLGVGVMLLENSLRKDLSWTSTGRPSGRIPLLRVRV